MRYTSPTAVPVTLTTVVNGQPTTVVVGPGMTELPAHFDEAAVEAGLLDETGKVSTKASLAKAAATAVAASEKPAKTEAKKAAKAKVGKKKR